jgi:hypothetical protein
MQVDWDERSQLKARIETFPFHVLCHDYEKIKSKIDWLLQGS